MRILLDWYNQISRNIRQVNFAKKVLVIEFALICLVIIFIALIFVFAYIQIDISIPVEKVANNRISVEKVFISSIPNTNNIQLKSGNKKINTKIIARSISSTGVILVLNTNQQNIPTKIRLIIAKKRIGEIIFSHK
ncbi:MAG: hypothetical protein WC860_01410 [Candidatus Margulisiibacteriota bacterium]|jgi:hypothetical protein